MEIGRLNWISYIVSGTLALFLAWALEGCRFGNHVDTGVPPTSSYSGYYQLRPARLSFCGVLAKTRCEDSTDLTQIPSLLTQVLTDPVAVIVKDPSTGEAYFKSPTGKSSLITTLDSRGGLSLKGSTPEEVFWQDPACTMHMEVTEKGLIDRSQGQGLPVNGNDQVTTSGRIQLDVIVVEVLKGNCRADLTLLSHCYDDATAASCGGSSNEDNQAIRQKVLAFFKPYVETKAFTTAEVPDLTAFGYQVSYR